MNPLRTAATHVIAHLADPQHGVVLREQLLDAGVPESTIRNWVRQGRLRQLHQGVHLVEGAALTWRGRAIADVMYVDRQARRIVDEHWVPHLAAVGGMAACHLHGFPHVPRPGRALVVANRASRSRRVVTRHLPGLREHDIVVVDGIRATTPGLSLLEADGFSRSTMENQLVELPRLGLVSRAKVRFPEATIEFDLFFGDHAEEIDGPHHLLPTQQQWDDERDAIAQRHGITVHRTPTAEIDLDLDGVVAGILTRVAARRARCHPRSTSS